MTYRLPSLYKLSVTNPTIAFRGVASENLLAVLATDSVFDAGLVKTGNGRTFGVTRYRYNSSGERLDNITDWALKQFQDRYKDEVAAAHQADRTGNGGMAQTITQPDGTVTELTIEPEQGAVLEITKDTIFAYCYAALHDPVYRETFAADLRREFPRIPLHDDFVRWAGWGQQLLDLHIGYEKAMPFKFTRIDTPGKLAAAPKLRSIPDEGIIIVDSDTQLTGIPREAWEYRLGSRSAIDWVLDQHKEKTPRDPTVREKFNTYRFADHKEEMIKLLARVITVSLETVKITEAMRAVERGKPSRE
jgi:predicted helicase